VQATKKRRLLEKTIRESLASRRLLEKKRRLREGMKYADRLT